MSNAPETLQDAWNWAGAVGHEAYEFAKFVAKYQLMHFLGSIAGAGLASAATAWAVHQGFFKESTINIGETIYTRSGVPNPQTGREFIDQQMITLSDQFTYKGAFHGSVGRVLAKKMAKASDLTTVDERVVIPHLADVIRGPDSKKFIEMVTEHWRSHHSGRLNPGMGPQGQSKNDRDHLPFCLWYIAPVVEPSHGRKSEKVLYVPPSFLLNDGLPHPDDLRVEAGYHEDGRIRFEHDPHHEANNRLITNMKIVDSIRNDPETWSKWMVREYLVPKNRTEQPVHDMHPAHP